MQNRQNFSAIDSQHTFTSFSELADAMLSGILPQPDNRGIVHVTVGGYEAPFYASLLSRLRFSSSSNVA